MTVHDKFIVPPMCPDRVICQWQFEGGGFIAVVSFGGPSTTEKLDAIQRMIDLKREEIKRSEPVLVTQACASADASIDAQ